LANGALVAGAVALAIARGVPASAEPSFFATLGPLLAWPFSAPIWALVVWAPAAVCIGVALVKRPTDATTRRLPLFAAWAVLQWMVLAVIRTPALLESSDLHAAAILLNAACFALLPATNTRVRTVNFSVFAIWAVLTGHALLQRPSPEPIQPDAPITRAFRQALIVGSIDALHRAPNLSAEERRTAIELFAQTEIHPWLPPSLRAPLELTTTGTASASGFRPGAAPELPARSALPAFGTWSAEGSGVGTGEFVSEPRTSPFAFVQILVAGTLRPPATSLVLRDAAGRETAPLDGAVLAPDRWRRINFPTPEGPFRVVARDASTTEWLAFTAPIEVSAVSRFAGKLPRIWPWLLGSGLALAAGGLVVGLQRSASPGPDTADGREPLLVWGMLPFIGLFAYAVFFSAHIDTTAGPNDSGGYLNSAKTLLTGNVTAAPRMLFGAEAGETDITPYAATTFKPRGDGRLVPEYPVGFPLEIWAVAQFLPLEKAVPTLILAQLVLGVVFTMLLAKAFGLADGWAWLAGGTIGFSPVYLFQGLQPQSDGPSLVWVTAAVYWAWTSRKHPWRAILAGLATALAVLIRPANVLCLLPIALCLAGSWRQTVGWALAGLPGALWLAWYNRELYGSPLATGYGAVGSGFGWRFLPLTLRSYARWLPEFFTPAVVGALAMPFIRTIPGRARLVLAGWIAAFVGFYAVYWCTWDNWYNMRFVLPAAPAMVVSALLVLRHVCERRGAGLFSSGPPWRTWVPTAALVMGALGFLSFRTIERRVTYWTRANGGHAVAAQWIRHNVPSNAVVFAQPATNPLMYYTDLVFVRSDHEKIRSSPEFFQRIASAGRPIYALTYHWEARGFDWARDGHGSGHPDLPGTWERIAALWDDDIHVWKQTSLDPPPAPPSPREESKRVR
ncbi:MAG: hypothetical protein ABIZ49_09110, partial [Opitutaceae bacterium]